MKSTAAVATPNKPRAAKRASSSSAKRSDRRVPFEEMRRLMTVYGSIKCLRKRQSASGVDGMEKVDSVKRKFYRWFPDLDERFDRDDEGRYTPKHGHEFEVRYREAMRAKDGETLAKKRARCRRQRYGVADTKPKAGRVPISSRTEAEIKLEFDLDPVCSAALLDEDVGPLPDLPFVSDEGIEEGIFDDVEKSFYPPAASVEDCPSMELSSCGSSSSASEGRVSLSPSWDSDSSTSIHDMKDVLDKSIEECCDDFLGSDSDDGDLFDMISV